jgi:ankyrin repeat protein
MSIGLGWTALLEAIILGDGGLRHVRIVSMLIDAGANGSLRDNDGVTPLQHARSRGYAKIANCWKRRGRRNAAFRFPTLCNKGEANASAFRNDENEGLRQWKENTTPPLVVIRRKAIC